MIPDAIARSGYDWAPNSTPPRLVRRTARPRLRLRWPYWAAALGIGVAYVLTNLWGTSPLLFLGMFGELPVLWVTSWFGVNVEAQRKRRWVLREVAFVDAERHDMDRSRRVGDVVVDGANVGHATAVTLARWRHHESGIHGEHKVAFRYEVSIVTARGVVTLYEGTEEELAIAFAQCVVEALGGTIPLVDRTEDALSGPNFVLWAVPFVAGAVITPLQMDANRRALIAVAVVATVLSNALATSAWIAFRARDHLCTVYGLPESSLPGLKVPFRYALAFAIAAHALLWMSILGPGGPHIAPR